MRAPRARRRAPTARATGATRGSSCWSPRAATRTRSRPPTSTRRRFAPLPQPAAARWSSLRAVALDALGMKRKAIELAAEELDRARDWGAPGTVARSLRVLGLLEGAEGLERLEEAVEVVRRAPVRGWSWPSRSPALGVTAPPRRPPRLRARAADPRARAGRGVRRRAPARRDPDARCSPSASSRRRRCRAASASLTATERRVAALAAAGRAEREIAQELFVTPRIIEIKLGSALRKLGASSQGELALALET